MPGFARLTQVPEPLQKKASTYTSASQSVGPSPAASVSSVTLLEMQILLHQELGGWDQAICALTRPPADSDWCTLTK